MYICQQLVIGPSNICNDMRVEFAHTLRTKRLSGFKSLMYNTLVNQPYFLVKNSFAHWGRRHCTRS